MYRNERGIRFLSSAASIKRTNWDPTVSLELKHPSLVLLEKCNNRDHFKQILGQMMRSNLIGQTFPMSRLIYFSAVSYAENLDMAQILFSHFTPNTNLYIYNTMISALVSANCQSFSLYSSMLKAGIYPDKHTLLYLLHVAKHISEVKQIHCHAIITGLFPYTYLQNSLIKMYLGKGVMWLVDKVLEQMPAPDAVSFNIVITGYAKKGYSVEALHLFRMMVDSGLQPDDFTMLGILKCCGQLGDVRFGKAVHAWMERRKSIVSLNLILSNALLDMYMKCQELELAQRAFRTLAEKDDVSWNTMITGCAKVGELELAETFFDQMPSKNIVSWNSLISGYASKGKVAMVRELLSNMVAENIMPDKVTMISLVSVAAEIGALDPGRCAHGWAIRMKMEIDAILGSALIEMYCRCGNIERAFMVFKGVPVKDVALWTSMITGFAFHGYGNKALQLFSEMQKDVIPNDVTFISVLAACNHSGLVDQGLDIFHRMKEFDIEPGVEHYACLVDLLGRAGRLAEAKHVIERMPMRPSRSIWGSVLNACRAQGDVEMAERALEELIKLEPEEEGGYMLLSNIYAASGEWSYSNKIREIMRSRGIKKTAGCSSVVVDGVIHNFIASDKGNPKMVEITSILNCLKHQMKRGAYFRMNPMQQLLETC